MKSLVKTVLAFCILHFAVSIHSNAQIVYTDVNPDATYSSTYNLDLNNDGATDFVFKHTTANVNSNNTPCQGQSGTNHYIKVSPSNNNQILNYTYYLGTFAAHLAPNFIVDASSSNWDNQKNQVMLGYVWGCNSFWYGYYWYPTIVGPWYQWNYPDAGFLGVKIIAGGQSYYGWVRMSITTDASSFTILDYAYNSSSDQAIIAGQTTASYLGISNVTSPLCAGKNVTIPYIISGPFAADNTVTAQLSDSTGSFANPIDIGSVTSNVSGNMTATIPKGAPNGYLFRIRLTSSNPSMTSYANVGNLTVLGGLPDGVITNYGSTNICDGYGDVALYASQSPCYSYQWRLNGVKIPGATDYFYYPTTAGNYRCVESNGVGAVASNIITVTAEQLPAEIYFCCGDPPAISCGDAIYLYTGYGYFTYQWQLNGADIPGATASNYYAGITGNYAVIKTTECGSSTSDIIPVSIYPDMDDATITIDGNTTVCTGPVTLNANTGAGLTYEWLYIPSGTYDWLPISGATGSSYDATVSGYYQVIETNINGCTRSSGSPTIQIGAPAASIAAYYGTALCHGNTVPLYAYPYDGVSYSYQWIKDGADIANATSYGYTATKAGNYTVRVMLTSGSCSSTAASVQVTKGCKLSDDNSMVDFISLSIAPNPVCSSTNISFTLERPQNVSLKIFDVTGSLISTIVDAPFDEGVHAVTWVASNVNAGIYLIRLDAGDYSQVQKISVIK